MATSAFAFKDPARIDQAFRLLFVAFAVSLPFSVKLYFPSIDLEIIFPAEPIIGLLTGLLLFSLLVQPRRATFDRSALKHPISILVVAWLVTSIVSTAFSTMPIVSWKALLVRCSYIVVFYFSFLITRAGSGMSARRSLKLHHWAFLAIVLFTLIKQSGDGFDRGGAGPASFPFYTDHTIYAAAMTFVLFSFCASLLTTPRAKQKGWRAGASMMLALLLVIALALSFCRAAWIATAVALLFFLLMRLGFAFRGFIGLGTLLLAALLLLRDPLVRLLRSSTVDSTTTDAGVWESVLSLTNISTDASNLERLNRWKCATRMFRERPLTGFGLGTYQFKYIDYQRPEERTYLSVGRDFDPAMITKAWNWSDRMIVRGNPQILIYTGGTAHSEYFLALSETGILTALLFIGLAFAAVHAGLRIMRRTKDPEERGLALAALLGLVAYFTHAFFNNFLDDCKLAFLFWASLAILASMDRRERSDERA